jgi:hypothetical protein
MTTPDNTSEASITGMAQMDTREPASGSEIFYYYRDNAENDWTGQRIGNFEYWNNNTNPYGRQAIATLLLVSPT